MSVLAQEARNSVVVLHQLIERIFNQPPGSDDSLQLLMSYFHTDFRMVTPKGKEYSLNDTEDLFRQLQGQRQGMRIVTCDHVILSHHDNEIIVQYREMQMINGSSQSRISLAILDCSSSIPRWRYLQETLIA